MGEAFNDFSSGLVDVKNSITSIPSSIGNFFNTLYQNLTKLGDDITSGISTFMTDLFVPDNEKMNANISEIKESFAFVEEIKTIQQSVFNAFNQSAQRPVISMDFSKANSKYGFDKGGTTFALDFAWYSTYKPAVDIIIIAFSYAIFILNVFRRLPEIISGSGAVVVTDNKISNYKGD
ncbi:hypothetical protein [Sedimentibacter sp.]|uniref:hypothetical protein n=1 Tax=Sedimentibacter sp. TaxID=1960295 RepID=UPI0028AD6596|nr:hypothetical protein [Sedimentibacter sp.]